MKVALAEGQERAGVETGLFRLSQTIASLPRAANSQPPTSSRRRCAYQPVTKPGPLGSDRRRRFGLSAAPGLRRSSAAAVS